MVCFKRASMTRLVLEDFWPGCARRLLEVAVRGCAVGKKFVTRYKYGSVMDVNL